MLEEPNSCKVRLFRGVDANELNVAAYPEPVEQPRPHGRASRRLFTGDSFVDVEVIHHLRAVIAILAFARVVIANARIDGNSIENVPIRLVIREEPVVVFLAAAMPEDVPGVDVVTGRENQAHVVPVDGNPQRLSNLELLAVVLRRLLDANAEVADDGKTERTGRRTGRIRMRPDAIDIPTATQSEPGAAVGGDNPISTLAACPFLAVHGYGICVLRVRLELCHEHRVAVACCTGSDQHSIACAEHVDCRFSIRI